MSAIADAYIVACERACESQLPDDIADLTGRFFSDEVTPGERAAVEAEFEKVTRADIGRPPLPVKGERYLGVGIDALNPGIIKGPLTNNPRLTLGQTIWQFTESGWEVVKHKYTHAELHPPLPPIHERN